MLNFSDELERNIVFVLEKAKLLQKAAEDEQISQEEREEIVFLASEIALSALLIADELERMKDIETFLMRNELVLRFKEIAYHCFDITNEDDADKANKAHILSIGGPCEYIAANIDLPEIKFEKAEKADNSDISITTALTVIHEAEEANEEEDPIEKLRAEIKALRELFASLVTERDTIKNVELPDIEARYMSELGTLEAEVYLSECNLQILKHELELIQIKINRAQRVKEEEIKSELNEDYKDYQKKYDEFVKKAKEASDYTRAREERRKRKSALQAVENTESSDGGENKEEQSSEDESQQRRNADYSAGDNDNTAGKKAEPESQPAEEYDEEKEMKTMYRKIVKAMHPDMHPDQDEETKTAFKKAIIAYKEGNASVLREIYSLYVEETPEDGPQLLESLQKEKEKLIGMIRDVRFEIAWIKENYPYKKKEILDNPYRLELLKKVLNARIESNKNKAEAYKKRIEELKEKHGGSDT